MNVINQSTFFQGEDAPVVKEEKKDGTEVEPNKDKEENVNKETKMEETPESSATDPVTTTELKKEDVSTNILVMISQLNHIVLLNKFHVHAKRTNNNI